MIIKRIRNGQRQTSRIIATDSEPRILGNPSGVVAFAVMPDGDALATVTYEVRLTRDELAELARVAGLEVSS